LALRIVEIAPIRKGELAEERVIGALGIGLRDFDLVVWGILRKSACSGHAPARKGTDPHANVPHPILLVVLVSSRLTRSA
jgi:hypothetical protein